MKKNNRRGIRILAAFTLVVFMMSISIVSFADSPKDMEKLNEKPERKSYMDGELIIKFKDGTSSVGMTSFASENGLKQKKSFESLNAGLYSVKGRMSTEKLIGELAKSDEIEYIQPNYLYYPAEVPEDEYFDNLWGMNNNVESEVDIDAPEAWDITQGEEDIVVAVIDTGIDINNPELADRMWTNPGEIPGNGIDDDDNNYIDDIHGWDFKNNDASVFDNVHDEHGTHVAGTIAAQADSDGVIGVAPGVKIMSLKFIGDNGVGSTTDAVEAIIYAKNKGVKLSNNSWGGTNYDALLEQTIKESGMLFVTAAGNGDVYGNGYDIDGSPVYPAFYDKANILTVAAVNSSGALADFSNFGATSVDVGAPGVDIFSTVPEIAEGTAAVTVSGAVYDQIFVAGFGIEDFTDSDNATALLDKALQALDIDAGDEILLVDDDESLDGLPDVRVYYNDVLNNLHYTEVDLSEVVSASIDGPGYAVLNNYDAVIWFTGRAYSTGPLATAITSVDQTSLKDYVAGGGKLLLFGEDALDGIEQSDFVKNCLNIRVTLSDYSRNWFIEGEFGTTFAGESYRLKYNNYRDHIEPLDNNKAKSVVKYGGGYYSYMDGTSMAAPHVTGVAALLLSKNPDLVLDLDKSIDPQFAPAKLKQAIMGSGTSLPALVGKTSTGKMANAFNALKAIAPGKPTNLKANKSGSNITLSWTGRETGDPNTYIVERSIAYEAFTFFKSTTGKTCPDSGIDTAISYRYRVKAKDGYNNESEYSDRVTANSGTSSTSSSGGGGGGGGGGGSSKEDVFNPSIDLKVESWLKSATIGESIEVPILKIVDKEIASISNSIVSKLSRSGKSLILKGVFADIEIPASALMTEEVKKYLEDSKANITISIKEIKGDAANKPESDETNGIFRIGQRLFEFKAELTTGGGTSGIKAFSQDLKISIKLTAAEADESSDNKLGVYYYNDEKEVWEYVGGIYNSKDNTIVFNTGHFSKFAVMRTESTYIDIDKHWAKAEIELLASRHIIEADASKKFGPDENIKRSEIVKMLVNILRYDIDKNIELITPAHASFKDVKADNPDYSYIETAVKYGITNGKGDGTFGPDDTVTREQLTTMIMRAMGIATTSDLSLLPFKDKDSIPAWAVKSIVAAYERGLVSGIEADEFGIGRLATRAQTAVILKRVMERTGLAQVTEKITGKLVISEIEGRHYELDTEDASYVLIFDGSSKYLDKVLSGSIGKEIEVTGYEQGGYSIYMKDKVFKVISVTAK